MKFNFLHQRHAEDAVLSQRYKYYVLNAPTMTDAEYDELEKAALKLWPHSAVLNSVGSCRPESYALYTREARWPNPEERAERDRIRDKLDEEYMKMLSAEKQWTDDER